MKKYIFIVAVLVVISAWFTLSSEAYAELELPNYANSANLDSDVQNKGKKITKTISLVVGVISILGMLIGSGYIGFGNSDTGKRYFLGGVVGISLASVVFGIASLVA